MNALTSGDTGIKLSSQLPGLEEVLEGSPNEGFENRFVGLDLAFLR